ncbi:hypothetical protein MF672_038965 [Actinomadura sp. ATCC 31491]|uniref:SPOR domain-containing protein n=1 Tax=Actinomadura luzonensis TaxID=2805427 RepID=A0ABT0G6L8_9ACTN|nr:hypothetical protein [Actinomadura luzonensis]MCK2219736.1 hypothetical protein [Actinomadura luzonensis]
MTRQLALFTPAPRKPPTVWGVQLNEVRLYHAAPNAMNWWLPYRHRFDTSGQVQILTTTLGGQVIQIGPYTDRDDADFIAAHLVEQGVPLTAVKTSPWSTPKEYAATVEAQRAARRQRRQGLPPTP